jgi:dihydroorotase
VVPIAALTVGSEGGRLTNFGRLKAVGAGAFGEGGRAVMNAGVMRRALEYSRLFDVPIFVHCEDTDLAGEGVMHEGAVALRLGLKGIPRTAESIMVARDVALAAATNGRLHIGHVSARESVEAIREAKRSGVRVTAEVTPHHLLMTDEDVVGYNTNAKVKPPLRAAEDRAALREALEDGTIDCIATSHAPHSSMSKDNLFDHAPFGVIGMESAFPILYTEFVVPGRWTLDFLVEKLSTAPARVMARPLGTLARGSAADFVLVDPNCRELIEARHLHSKSANCPFLGREVRARIAATFVAARAVFHRPEVFPGGPMARRADEPAPDPAKRRKDKSAKEKPAKDKKKNRKK